MEYECIKEVAGRDGCNCPKCIQEKMDSKSEETYGK